ncbi:hypothetical protein AOU00_03220 [Paenibacillus polymyxa]|nr:hypothetical protein AOU00_03220 [Paenibacillus polymyxa]KYG96063.1 hypothetical protein AZE31_20060 [Paenibacillus polymyxa]
MSNYSIMPPGLADFRLGLKQAYKAKVRLFAVTHKNRSNNQVPLHKMKYKIEQGKIKRESRRLAVAGLLESDLKKEGMP